MNQLQAFKRLQKMAKGGDCSIQKEYCSWYKEPQWTVYISDNGVRKASFATGTSLMELLEKAEAYLNGGQK
jgi:hypothetical protein